MPENNSKNRLKKFAKDREGKAVGIRIEIEGDDLTPIGLLMAIIKDNRLPVMMRIEAAGKAAPYIHQKKPIAIEGTDKPLISQDDLRGLSKAELALMRNLLMKMGVGIADATSTTH